MLRDEGGSENREFSGWPWAQKNFLVLSPPLNAFQVSAPREWECRRGGGIQQPRKVIMRFAETTENTSNGTPPLPRWKRVLDLLCLAVSLPLIGGLGAVIALWIKLVSSGPVFFRQERVGYGGQRFLCYKFRTMKVHADTSNHRDYLHQLIASEVPMIKLDSQGDDRLIPGAAFLRATGLDELPQLLNVWRAEMSLVGPRPCLPYEYEQYSDWQKGRFAAVPGLTGLWQVSGKNRTTFKQMIHLDIQYAEHKSLRLDLAIILKTPVVLLQQVLAVRGTSPAVYVPPLQKAAQ